MDSKDYADKIAEEVIAAQVPLGESITLSDLLAAAARKGYLLGYSTGLDHGYEDSGPWPWL